MTTYEDAVRELYDEENCERDENSVRTMHNLGPLRKIVQKKLREIVQREEQEAIEAEERARYKAETERREAHAKEKKLRAIAARKRNRRRLR